MSGAADLPVSTNNSSVIKDLEDEILRMKMSINEMLAKEALNDSEVESAHSKSEMAQREASTLRERVDQLTKALSKRDVEFHDLCSLQKELELELVGVLADRNELLNDRRRSQELETQLMEYKQNLDASEKRRKQYEITADRLAQENTTLNVKCQDFLKIQSENTKLTLLVSDFKSRRSEDSANKRNYDCLEVPKESMNDLVQNVQELEHALKLSTSAAASEFDALNQKQKILSSIARAHGKISCLLALVRKSLVSFATTIDVDLIAPERFDRDPLDGLLAFTQNAERYLQKLLENKAVLDSEILSVRSTSLLEMSWEASSYSIPALDNFTLPLYGSAGSLRVTLTWTFSCALSDYLQVYVSYHDLIDGDKMIPLVSNSSRVDGNVVLSGSLTVSGDHRDISVIISNRSIWASAVVAYHFGLLRENADSNVGIQSLLRESNRIDSVASQISILTQHVHALFRRIDVLVQNFDIILRKLTGYANNIVDRNGLLSCLFNKLVSHSLHVSRVLGSVSSQNEKSRMTTDVLGENSLENVASSEISVHKRQFQSETPQTAISSSSGIVTYSAESISVRASDDLRLTLPPLVGRVRISWSVQVKRGTIGFTIGKLLASKEVPLLIPYARSVEKSREPIVGYKTFEFESVTTIVIFFDNTFSWLTPKQLKYCITVESYLADIPFQIREDCSSKDLDHDMTSLLYDEDGSGVASDTASSTTDYAIMANVDFESEIKDSLTFFDTESKLLEADVIDIINRCMTTSHDN